MRYLIAFCIGLSLFSCETLINDIDPAKLGIQEENLVINSYLNPSDSIITAKVHLTKPIFATKPANFTFGEIDNIVTDAKVEISSQTQKISLIYNTTEKIYMANKKDFKINPKESYSLKVTDNKGKTYTSSTVIPEAVEYTIGTLVEKQNQNQNNNSTYKFRQFDVSIEINLAPNSYIVGSQEFSYQIFNQNTKTYSPNFYPRDINIENLKNENTVNKKEKIATSIYLNYDEKIASDFKTKIVISNFDKNLYLYNKSVKDSYNSDNPFVEPSLIKTNINGALGCFGSYNKNEKILPIKY